MYCGNCGQKKESSYCGECNRKTLQSPVGFNIPQIPMSFDDTVVNYNMMVFRSGHIMHHLNLETDSPFGNLSLVFMNLLQDIEYLNSRIKNVYVLYASGMYCDMELSIKPTDHLRTIEEVVYWIRRITDRLISIHWLVYDYSSKGKYSDKIDIDCIGKLLRDDDLKKEYSEQDVRFLVFVNEVSNAYKHSLINDEAASMRIGQIEPLVISLGLRFNNIESQQRYKHDSLSNLIQSFIVFYKNSREKIEACTKQD